MGQKPDYLIKEKGADGKYKTVGGAWSKDGQYGPFFSLSLGPKGDQKSYVMAKNTYTEESKKIEPPKSSVPDDL